MCRPGIEPRPTAWKAAMLTITSSTHLEIYSSLKPEIILLNQKIQIQKKLASSRNRTRATRVAGEHSTTEPTMLTCYGSFRSHVRPEFTRKIMILTKLHASTGNRTGNNSLESCYTNHYTIDALGDLLIFKVTNYIFKSKIQIQKELASSGNPTQAESNLTDCLYCG